MRKLNPKWITKTKKDRLYHLPVPVIGLTGGIATGKSRVADILKSEGFALIDADKLVKNIYAMPEALSFVQKQFPGALTEQKIDFKKLRAEVFSDQKKQEQIEQFIYSKLPDEFLNAFHAFQGPDFIFYDVPLLFEKKLDQKVDVSICVYSPRPTQLERLINRDKISIELANKILDQQTDIEEKKKLSDLIIENVGDQLELKKNIKKIIFQLLE